MATFEVAGAVGVCGGVSGWSRGGGGKVATTAVAREREHSIIRVKVIKSSFLGLIFPMSGAKARKISKRASWGWFCRFLDPKLESH